MVRGRKGEYDALLDDLAKQGFARARVDGEVVELTERATVDLARYEQHTIEVVVDRLVRRDDIRQRLTESMETALRLADGDRRDRRHRTRTGPRSSSPSPSTWPAPSAVSPSRNPRPATSPSTRPTVPVPTCDGLGTQFEVDPELVVPDPTKTLADGALTPWAGGRSRWFDRMLEAVADEHGFSVDDPVGQARAKRTARSSSTAPGPKQVHLQVPQPLRSPALLPSPTTRAIVPWLQRRHSESESEGVREWTETFMREVPCSGVRRGATQARVPGRDHRRPQHLRAVQPVDHAPRRPRWTRSS